MDGGLAAAIAGVASAVAVIITSLRKRKDVDIREMETRIESLTERLGSAEQEIGNLRRQVVALEGENFLFRRTFAERGIPIPIYIEGAHVDPEA